MLSMKSTSTYYTLFLIISATFFFFALILLLRVDFEIFAYVWHTKCPMTFSVIGPQFFLERARGIEPPSKAWEASILPMNYARAQFLIITHLFRKIHTPWIFLPISAFLNINHPGKDSWCCFWSCLELR